MVTDNEKQYTDSVENADDITDGIRQEKENFISEIESRDAVIARLEQSLAAQNEEIQALTQSLDEARQKIEELDESLTRAVAAYREMVVEVNPGIVADLVSGNTIEEVDESLRNARVLMDRVRQEMEAEIARTRVPAGAPPRGPLDLSGLSPREKIQYGIGGISS
jgi:chromosome segregation ATPase